MSDIEYRPESVYNLVLKKEIPTKKLPRYVSKFRPAVLEEERKNKHQMRSMGPAKVEATSPDKYLKKGSKDCKKQESGKTQQAKDVHKTCTVRKQEVPGRTVCPATVMDTNKGHRQLLDNSGFPRDIQKRNWREVPEYLQKSEGAFYERTHTLPSMPRKHQPACVDTAKGHKQLLAKSGLVPEFIRKKDYGAGPDYLQRLHQEAQRVKREYEDRAKELNKQEAQRRLSNGDRQVILERLKKKWDAMHHEFQGLPFVIDTVFKNTYKKCLETELTQLEKDISLFESHKTIYISNDSTEPKLQKPQAKNKCRTFLPEKKEWINKLPLRCIPPISDGKQPTPLPPISTNKRTPFPPLTEKPKLQQNNLDLTPIPPIQPSKYSYTPLPPRKESLKLPIGYHRHNHFRRKLLPPIPLKKQLESILPLSRFNSEITS